jgi:hypothetical protein
MSTKSSTLSALATLWRWNREETVVYTSFSIGTAQSFNSSCLTIHEVVIRKRNKIHVIVEARYQTRMHE